MTSCIQIHPHQIVTSYSYSVCVNVCIYVCVCVYVRVYICIYHVLPTFHICLMSPLGQLTSLRMRQSLGFVGGDCKVLWNSGNTNRFAPCHLFQGDQRQYSSPRNFTLDTGLRLPIFSIYILTYHKQYLHIYVYIYIYIYIYIYKRSIFCTVCLRGTW